MEDELHRLRRFAWVALFVWALCGGCLELAHAFKWAAYLDDEVSRLMLRLAHAHGVGLSLVVLVFSASGLPLFEENKRHGLRVGRRLRVGALLLPLGFLLGAFVHSESDPGLGIVLAPAGALCLLTALAETAWASVKAQSRAVRATREPCD